MYKCIWMHTCNVVHFKVKGQLGELFFPSPCGSQGLSPSSQVWQYVPIFFFNDLNILSL